MLIDKFDELEKLDEAIDHTLTLMNNKPEPGEYTTLVDHLTKLIKNKETLLKLKQEAVSKNRVSKDTLAIIAGNLAGIVLILGHERAHVVASKALGFVMKAR